VIPYTHRRDSPKSGTDWRDIVILLLTFPKLKRDLELVTERLDDLVARERVFDIWRECVEQEIKEEEE